MWINNKIVVNDVFKLLKQKILTYEEMSKL